MGYGAQLINYVLDFAKQKDFLRITLLTDRLDEKTKQFFQQHGFDASEMVPMRWLPGGGAPQHPSPVVPSSAPAAAGR